jgi:hypothetical protein
MASRSGPRTPRLHRRKFPLCRLLLLVHSVGLVAAAQSRPSLVTACDLLQSPANFDKQTVQLRGDVHLAFEEFTLTSESCPHKWPGIWLAFGGDRATPTMSTANDTVRAPGDTPVFEGVSVSLTKDDNLERFFTLIAARHGRDQFFHVTATLTGTFFAGNRNPRSTPGYGHMDAFFLFVISEVDAVEAEPTPQLNVSGTITDAAGKPIDGVDVYSQTVNCCQVWMKETTSDDRGSFSLKNTGQVLTFSRLGYSPRSVVLEVVRSDVHVVLEAGAQNDWLVPACAAESSNRQFGGLPLRFSIPEGLHGERINSSSDSSFIIHSKPGPNVIRLLKASQSSPYGQMASWVFGSEAFSQRNVVNAQGVLIGIDTKGTQQNRGFWRTIAIPRQEIVEYYVVSREVAELFDKVIDSGCVQ